MQVGIPPRIRGEFLRVVGDELKARPVGVEHLTATGAVDIPDAVLLERVTDANERFGPVKGTKLPRHPARFGIERDTNAPHHIGSAYALEAVLPHDLDRQV